MIQHITYITTFPDGRTRSIHIRQCGYLPRRRQHQVFGRFGKQRFCRSRSLPLWPLSLSDSSDDSRSGEDHKSNDSAVSICYAKTLVNHVTHVEVMGTALA